MVNIRAWSDDQVMQLPDHIFGERYIVSCYGNPSAGTTVWDISEIAFPERMILWSLVIAPQYLNNIQSYIRIALGDQLPTTIEQMSQLEPLVRGIGQQGAEPRELHWMYTTATFSLYMRKLINSAGRRMIVEYTAKATYYCTCHVMCVISAIPREVPEWLLGKQGGVQL
jgi:hypothetical protein